MAAEAAGWGPAGHEASCGGWDRDQIPGLRDRHSPRIGLSRVGGLRGPPAPQPRLQPPSLPIRSSASCPRRTMSRTRPTPCPTTSRPSSPCATPSPPSIPPPPPPPRAGRPRGRAVRAPDSAIRNPQSAIDRDLRGVIQPADERARGAGPGRARNGWSGRAVPGAEPAHGRQGGGGSPHHGGSGARGRLVGAARPPLRRPPRQPRALRRAGDRRARRLPRRRRPPLRHRLRQGAANLRPALLRRPRRRIGRSLRGRHAARRPRAGAGPDALAALLDRPENRPFRPHVRALPFDPAYAADSATVVREAARAGRPYAGLVPPEAAAFIAEAHPYAVPRTPPDADVYTLREAAIAALAADRDWAERHADLRALLRLALSGTPAGRTLQTWLAAPPQARAPARLRDLIARLAPTRRTPGRRPPTPLREMHDRAGHRLPDPHRHERVEGGRPGPHRRAGGALPHRPDPADPQRRADRQPLGFEPIPGHRIVESYFDDAILPRPPDGLALVAPCSFNSLNKLAAGIADNLALSTVADLLGRGLPLGAPARSSSRSPATPGAPPAAARAHPRATRIGRHPARLGLHRPRSGARR